MKTLAEFKRSLEFGSSWECQHVQSGTTLGIRKVAKKNTVKVGFMTEEGKISYLNFPPAKYYRWNEDTQEAEIYGNFSNPNEKENINLILTYRKLSEK